MTFMKRVAVIGSPGTGKTTFVKKLALKTGLPIIHLDFYYHQKQFDYRTNQPAWIKKVTELSKQDKWIMDGNYNSSFEVRFKRADTIIFLDLPRRIAFYGVIKRRIQYHGKLRDDMPSDWKEKANWEFLKYVWKFNGEHRDIILSSIDNTKGKKVVVFNNRKQLNSYVSNNFDG